MPWRNFEIGKRFGTHHMVAVKVIPGFDENGQDDPDFKYVPNVSFRVSAQKYKKRSHKHFGWDDQHYKSLVVSTQKKVARQYKEELQRFKEEQELEDEAWAPTHKSDIKFQQKQNNRLEEKHQRKYRECPAYVDCKVHTIQNPRTPNVWYGVKAGRGTKIVKFENDKVIMRYNSSLVNCATFAKKKAMCETLGKIKHESLE